MDPTLVTILTLPVINLSLAALVYWHDPRKATNRTFALFVLAISAWAFATRLVYLYAAEPSGIAWGRMSFVAAGLIGTTFYALSTVFPDQPRLPRHLATRVMVALGVLISGIALTPFILAGIESSTVPHVAPQYGPLYPIFALYMVTTLGCGGWMLFRKCYTARGRSRLQLQYLWLGLALFLGGAAVTNLLIPALTGSSRYGLYGPYFSLLLVGLTTHAIIRHRLMDIRLVIRQSVTYVLSVGTVVGLIWGLLEVLSHAVGPQFDLSWRSLPLVIGIAGVAVFHPVRLMVQRLFDRYCYRREYDYRHAIKTISQVLAGLLRLDPLCAHLSTFVLNTLRVEHVAVYPCHDRIWLEPRCAQHVNPEEQPTIGALTLALPHLLQLLARAGGPVAQDELTLWAEQGHVEALREEFTQLRSKVVVPLLVEQQVAGFIAVGEKLSGDPFFTHDLELLATVGNQAGIALKRAQLHEEVTWMKEYNENILRHMESGLVVVNRDGAITVANEAAARMLGMTIVDMAGKPLDTLHPSGLGRPLLDTLMQKTSYANHEALLLSTTGQTLPVVLSTSMLRNEEGQPAGAILAINDVSQIKALEEEKRRIERLASIGAFMSGIAHEIKNPLVAIKTLAELLPEQYDDAEFRDTFTKVTLNEVDRIDSLVRRLRSLSTGAAVPLRPLSIIPALEETLALISGELMRRKVTVLRDYRDPLPSIMGDHDQLKQVFVNLCLNSAEAMGDGGTLTVTVQHHWPQDARSAQVIIQIADTGPGIPEEHLSQIFDPFFTLKDEGTGLGLAISRGILDHHRGSITAANRPEGCGAIFTLRLPVARGADVYESTAACRQ